MNATIRTLATLAVAATLVMTGCKKDDVSPITPNSPDNPGEEPIENIYVGTTWEAHLENQFFYQGIEEDVTYDVTLDFLDSVNAELFHDIYVYLPEYPAYSQSENATESLTYEFFGDTVVLYGTYVDEENGDTVDYKYDITHDKVANTLTMVVDDADMRDIMGTDTIVFTPRANAASKNSIIGNGTLNSRNRWQKLMDKIAAAIEK